MLRKLQTIKAIVCTLTLAVICGLSTTRLRAQESNVQPDSGQMERSSEAQGRRFEGSWEVIVDPDTPTTRHVYGSFTRGGVFAGSDRLAPFAGPGHGVWEHLGGDRYAYFFKQDQFDDKGKLVGVLTLRARLSLVGKDEFAGVAQGGIVEPNGNRIQLPCGMIRGIRIKLEPLPDRCRNIMPGLLAKMAQRGGARRGMRQLTGRLRFCQTPHSGRPHFAGHPLVRIRQNGV